MCADFRNLADEVRNLDKAGADRFHLDVMDGVFVPNYAMGLHDVEAVRAATTKPIDCHLMVANPLLAVDVFAAAGASIMHAHLESTPQIGRVLQRMVDLGVEPGIAINPGTAASAVEPLLDAVTNILVMTVNPGFAGQKYLDWVDRKIESIVAMRGSLPITLSVDGAISASRVRRLSGMGVDAFILGTSALFGRNANYSSSLAALHDGDQ
jgi:ribulose-phosphate 3-epimerase